MDQTTLRAAIALPLLPEVGIRTARQLITAMGSPEAVMEAISSASGRATITRVAGEYAASRMPEGLDAALRRADEEVAWITKHDIRTCYFEDTDFPDSLRELPDGPILLYAKGNIRLNEGHLLSIVGTRMPSDRGKQLCHDLVLDLAKKVPGLVIVSGLAYGIDVTAHRAALEAGIPTFIIPAHGLDRIYPAEHRQVAVQALQQGGILTEYMQGTTPERQNFVARNRIVAGLSEATLVVESKARGGSLITAGLANRYGRKVFAIPGRPTDDRSAGCNALIRQGNASLITCADNLIEAMGWGAAHQAVQTSLPLIDLTPEEESIFSLIEEDGTHINDIVARSGRSFAEVSSLLFSLEMKDAVRALPGGLYRK